MVADPGVEGGALSFLDPLTAGLLEDWEYYALLIPASIPALATFAFLAWLGHQFFVNN